jgi:uncharacterized membrane protein YphA (DoxX/SURF4 family)
MLAGVPKLQDPATFVEQISNYNLLVEYAPVLAVSIPGIEVTAALALLLTPRQWRQAAALVLMGMLCGFAVAVTQAWVRGIDVDCGCFGRSSGRIGPWSVLRNLSLILMAGAVVWLEMRPRRR